MTGGRSDVVVCCCSLSGACQGGSCDVSCDEKPDGTTDPAGMLLKLLMPASPPHSRQKVAGSSEVLKAGLTLKELQAHQA